MKLKLTKRGEPKRYPFMDGFLFIKQFPASRGALESRPDGYVRLNSKDLQEAFVECLTGWENFNDEADGKPIKLTEDLKRMLFDYPDEELAHDGETLVQFVLRRGKVLAAKEEEQEKN